jgi:hypothetical protein
MAGPTPHDRRLEVADFLLEEGEDSRYIPVPQPGRPYRLECGIATRSGVFIAICASNEVRTPLAEMRAAAHLPPAGQRTAAGLAMQPGLVPGDEGPMAPVPARSPGERTPLMGGAAQGLPVPESGDLALCGCSSAVW